MRICTSPIVDGQIFQFDKKTRRYLYLKTPITGYVYNENNSDTNTMNAGTCQKF